MASKRRHQTRSLLVSPTSNEPRAVTASFSTPQSLFLNTAELSPEVQENFEGKKKRMQEIAHSN